MLNGNFALVYGFISVKMCHTGMLICELAADSDFKALHPFQIGIGLDSGSGQVEHFI